MIPTKETITVVKSGGLDEWGRPIQSNPVNYSCRIDYKVEIVKDDNGEEKVAKATILIKGVADVSTEDTLEWNDSFGEHSARPITVNPLKDLSSKVIFTRVVI